MKEFLPFLIVLTSLGITIGVWIDFCESYPTLKKDGAVAKSIVYFILTIFAIVSIKYILVLNYG